MAKGQAHMLRYESAQRQGLPRLTAMFPMSAGSSGGSVTRIPTSRIVCPASAASRSLLPSSPLPPFSPLKHDVAFMAASAGCMVSGHKEDATVALLLNEFTASEFDIMFPVSPTKQFAAEARAIAVGADSRHPGDADVKELDKQLRVLRAATVSIIYTPSKRYIRGMEAGGCMPLGRFVFPLTSSSKAESDCSVSLMEAYPSSLGGSALRCSSSSRSSRCWAASCWRLAASCSSRTRALGRRIGRSSFFLS
jgi:hypothetical protein